MPVASVSPGEPHDGKLVRLATSAMGTRFEFVLHGDDQVRLRAAGEAALTEILSLHRRLSAFDRASDVSRLNREAGRGWVRVDGQVFALLALCRQAWRKSGGAFDVTIGPLMTAWGFRGGEGHGDAEAIAAAAERTGFDKVELDPNGERVRYLDPGVQIDLGAVGKGFALDAAAVVLREGGVECAFLHGGTSSCLAIGAPEAPEGPPDGWRVRLGDSAEAPVVALANGALGMSAPHGRMVVSDQGETLGHVLDPRSGRPARGVRHAAALAGSAAVADASSTAALVLGIGGVERDGAGAGVSLGVQVHDAGTERWTFQGCWPLVDVQRGAGGEGGRRAHAMAGVT